MCELGRPVSISGIGDDRKPVIDSLACMECFAERCNDQGKTFAKEKKDNKINISNFGYELDYSNLLTDLERDSLDVATLMEERDDIDYFRSNAISESMAYKKRKSLFKKFEENWRNNEQVDRTRFLHIIRFDSERTIINAGIVKKDAPIEYYNFGDYGVIDFKDLADINDSVKEQLSGVKECIYVFFYKDNKIAGIAV